MKKGLNIRGVWKLDRWYVKHAPDDWRAVPYFTKQEEKPWYWIFGRQGYMIEGNRSSKKYISQFWWNTEEMELTIDESHYERDGFCSIYQESRYRVVKNGRWSITIYHLKDVENEPEDYHSRLILNRRWLDIMLLRY